MIRKILLVLGFCLTLYLIQYISYAQSFTGRLADYQGRLERVLQIKINSKPLATAPYRIPALKLRQAHNPATRNQEEQLLGLQEVATLFNCPVLSTVVSEHLSILGKVAKGSEMLLYQNQFLHYLPQCLDAFEGRDVKIKLLEIAQQKKANINQHIWAGTFGSPAFTQAFGTQDKQTTRLSDLENLGSHPMPESLLQLAQHLSKWRQDPEALIPQKLYRATFEAIESDFYADLISGLNLSLQELPAMSNGIMQAQSTCQTPAFKKQLPILNAILMKTYGNEVQPYFTQLDQAAKSLIQAKQQFAKLALAPELMRDLKARSPEIFAFIQSDRLKSLHQDFLQAIADHQQAWQGLVDECQLQLGRP